MSSVSLPGGGGGGGAQHGSSLPSPKPLYPLIWCSVGLHFVGSAVRALSFDGGRDHGPGEKKYTLYIQLGEDSEFTVSVCVCVNACMCVWCALVCVDEHRT